MRTNNHSLVLSVLCLLTAISHFSCQNPAVQSLSADGTVTPAAATTPVSAPVPVLSYDWRNAVIYTIQIDRFYDGDPANNPGATLGTDPLADYKGGDLAGIMSKLSSNYFTDLGVNVLCLSCPFASTSTPNPAPASPSHKALGFDGSMVTDPSSLDSRFGTKTNLTSLVSAAHAKNIRVILEYSPKGIEQTASLYTATHPSWFKTNGVLGSLAAPWDSPTAYLYQLNNYSPIYDFDNQSALQYSIQSLASWVSDTNIDGFWLKDLQYTYMNWLPAFRNYLISSVEKNRGERVFLLVDSPKGLSSAPYTFIASQANTWISLQSMADAIVDHQGFSAYQNSILLPQAPVAPITQLDSYLATQTVPLVYGYVVNPTFDSMYPWRASYWASSSYNSANSDPWNFPATSIETAAYERVGNALTITMTTPGIPSIEYGDEIGISGYGNPDAFRFMYWSALNSDQQALHDKLAKLAAIRSGHASLRHGVYGALGTTTSTIAYSMTDNLETVYILVNIGNSIASIGGLPNQNYADLLNGGTVSGPIVSVPARSSRILIKL